MTGYRWQDDASCRGLTHRFYDDVWVGLGTGKPQPEALKWAKAMCAACPVLSECRSTVFLDERDIPADLRYGVCAGMTPQERVGASEYWFRHEGLGIT